MLIPLAMLAACGPDEDDSNSATRNTTAGSEPVSPDGSGATTIAGGTGASNQTANSSDSSDNSTVATLVARPRETA